MEKVLIVVDMQKDFVDGSLGTAEAVAIVDKVASRIAAFDGRIFATLDTHQADYLETAEGKKLPVPHCIKDTDGWLLNEKVMYALSEKNYRTIEKGTFGSTKLVEEIAKLAADGEVAVELIGLCTDICVVSNALLLKAHFPEMGIAVDASCCAGVTPKTHEAALETMKMCQIDIIGA
ncbi:MAG: cysteine hydrolase [Lachnospiraceae bacterium]|jgi:nicotinamidase-related amidase|uniref:cysteine hydrolase family protein n=1 Tax=uncultured Acetatifactor sp. TaxID=1671927 RepID=UPI0026164A83|nr:isochorismatase family cysteine hydrolase [uncultured Acetatifactor sp.]MCI8788116.1 cysteine hydrolase [Lachnospiraceae bacterium]